MQRQTPLPPAPPRPAIRQYTQQPQQQEYEESIGEEPVYRPPSKPRPWWNRKRKVINWNSLNLRSAPSDDSEEETRAGAPAEQPQVSQQYATLNYMPNQVQGYPTGQQQAYSSGQPQVYSQGQSQVPQVYQQVAQQVVQPQQNVAPNEAQYDPNSQQANGTPIQVAGQQYVYQDPAQFYANYRYVDQNGSIYPYAGQTEQGASGYPTTGSQQNYSMMGNNYTNGKRIYAHDDNAYYEYYDQQSPVTDPDTGARKFLANEDYSYYDPAKAVNDYDLPLWLKFKKSLRRTRSLKRKRRSEGEDED